MTNNQEIEHGINIDEFDPYSKTSTLRNIETNGSVVDNFDFEPLSSRNNNEAMSQNFQYNRSMSENFQKDAQKSNDSQNNPMLLFSADDESEKRKPKYNDHSPVSIDKLF